MDCSPPGSSVHGIYQIRIQEYLAIPFSKGSSQPRDPIQDPALQADSLLSEPPGKPIFSIEMGLNPRMSEFIANALKRDILWIPNGIKK